MPAISADRWGCSSNGRAPALHAGGTGIDTLLLHTFFVSFSLSVSEEEDVWKVFREMDVKRGFHGD